MDPFEKFAATAKEVCAEQGTLEDFNKWYKKSKQRIADGESYRTILLEELCKMNAELKKRSERN